MAESKTTMESARNGSSNTSFVQSLGVRLHAQALTLAALAGAAAVEYYDHKTSQSKEDSYPKFVPLDSSHKN
ncbi:Adenylate cyclase type 4 [Bienertia sinuspersici]